MILSQISLDNKPEPKQPGKRQAKNTTSWKTKPPRLRFIFQQTNFTFSGDFRCQIMVKLKQKFTSNSTAAPNKSFWPLWFSGDVIVCWNDDVFQNYNTFHRSNVWKLSTLRHLLVVRFWPFLFLSNVFFRLRVILEVSFIVKLTFWARKSVIIRDFRAKFVVEISVAKTVGMSVWELKKMGK